MPASAGAISGGSGIGIGHPGDKERVLGHVLGDFHKAELPWVEELLDAIADAIGAGRRGRRRPFHEQGGASQPAPKPKKGDAAA